jgi:hypothetical protein
MLDDSNCRFLIVSYPENESHVFFEGIEVGKESVGITIYRSIFEELIEVRFDLVLGAST